MFYISNMALHLMLIKFKSCFKTAFKLFILHVCLYFFSKIKANFAKDVISFCNPLYIILILFKFNIQEQAKSVGLLPITGIEVVEGPVCK